MEMMDPEVARRVWQRVQGTREEQEEHSSLRPLLLAALEAAAEYARLAKTLTGRRKELVRRLLESQQESVAILKGLVRLAGEGADTRKSMPMSAEPAEKALEKRYHVSRRTAMEYTARSAEGEFGSVFRELAQQEQLRCVRIAQLLGTMP